MNTKITFTAVGDLLIQRRICSEYEGYKEVQTQIKKGDFRFVNLETTVHYGEHFGNQFNGGSYLMAKPGVLRDAKELGFNVMSFANNHSMDFGHGGLLDTKKYVDEAGFVNTGAGANIDEASSPAYLDLPQGRVALISVVETMSNPAAMAGKQSRRFKGRPGVNGLRTDEYLELTKEEYDTIKQIVDKSHINAHSDIIRAEGYLPPIPDGVVQLKEMEFRVGKKTKYVTRPNNEDVERIKKSIYEAQMQADYIIISIHSHAVSGTKKENPSDCVREFAHMAIDAGAHAIIGHGPHLLRPLEIYKNRPIFYSLGDFVIHNECIPCAPEEMYEKQGLTSDATMREVFCDRSANYTRGLMRDHRMLESMIPYFEFEEGKLKYLELMPIELNFDKKVWQSGNPRFSKNHGIIERLAEMSAEYGTEITIDERGYGIVKL